MKRIILMLFVLGAALPTFGQDASTAWRNIMKKCAKTDLIGKESLFFGVSNIIGPGSIWRRADDKSIRLVMVLSDPFPNATDQASIVREQNTVACTGNSSSSWSVKLGLPFSTGATPLTLDIGAVLGGAHKVTVSVQGYAMDTLDEADWQNAFLKLGTDNVFYQDAQKPNLMLAENAIKVTGFKAIFEYSHDIEADLSAKYKGASFILGNSSTGTGTSGAASAIGALSKDIQAANGGKGGTSATGPGTGNSKTNSKKTTSPTTSAGASTSSTGCSANDDFTADTPTAAPTSSAGSTNTKGASAQGSNTTPASTTGGTSLATLHVGFSGKRQIVICADGPFYILAAYSNLLLGNPIGVAPGAKPVITLTPATLPSGALAATERPQGTSF